MSSIPSSGSYTSATVRTVLGLSGSYSSSKIRDLNGIGSSGAFTTANMRGLSVMSVSVGNDKTEYFTGTSGQRFTLSITASVSGGESPYSFNWTRTSGSTNIGISSGGTTATVTLDVIMPLQYAVYTSTFRCTVNSKVYDEVTVTFNMIMLDFNPDL